MENSFSSYLLVIEVPSYGFGSWVDGGSNAPIFPSWGQ